MSTNRPSQDSPWQGFYGPNLGYVIELFEQYTADPNSVDEELRQQFEAWGPPPSTDEADENIAPTQQASSGLPVSKIVAASKLAENIRTYGHLAADIHPLNETPKNIKMLDPTHYGLSEGDLKTIPATLIWSEAPRDVKTALDAILRLKDLYTKSLAYEFSHVHVEEERNWLNNMVESGYLYPEMTNEQKIALLKRLSEVEGFEKFLHKTFVGQKRFSIEGLDILVPMLDEIVSKSVKNGTKNVMVGMAHRGRLNVLAHTLGKPYEKIFSEFHHSPNKELIPSEGSRGINFGWSGDVKYHLGADRSIEENTVKASVTLANNPSHLEFVNPVVVGYTRAAQEVRTEAGYPVQDVNKSFSISIHGDAAFPGEGIVAETLNLSRLKGYQTGGTVHIIANNMIGFTTESYDSRSTKYSSDLAKGFEIPIVHVNADDPIACIAAASLAYEYRTRFQKDFLIDLIGYRRFGHNEMDDPTVTQPALYEKVNNHPTVRTLFAKQLETAGVLAAGKGEEIDADVQQMLQEKYDKVKGAKTAGEVKDVVVPETIVKGIPKQDTAVDHEQLKAINKALLERPEEFNAYPKLERILARRANALEEGGKVDWALAETLAFASILSDGTPIRITGQDSERGTFAQRHLVLHDSKNGKLFSPLHHIPQVKASFGIHNSPLSEASVVGFEYGYNVFAPETLVLWEAQYGDFANCAQVIFDQFLSAGRAKWGQKSGLVLLLPHGYEGQGPEHSSGRIERFLQLAAENNWTVANLSSASQYFHVLRRQAAILNKEEVRPLVIMTPKSLLRNPRVASDHTLLSQGRFQLVVEEELLGKNVDQVKRIILSSGKVAIDLATEIEGKAEELDHVHALRVEQLYPFPKNDIKDILNRYPNLEEISWVQEEPKNMGSWAYIESKLRGVAPEGVAVKYIGRPDRSSPSGGDPEVHKKEQERIVSVALRKEQTKTTTHEGGNERD
ncbi:2-oxoglutarate dehydrogenase E1 component [Fictibacillus macauensis ZFHKF-1]|uniref:2-oxoglutarate dehydrogenase E1 component n=1 Tax=Fictibacillus macauensis ZFHKF-1 TaxID=1196324 RepID=I8ALJ0_9BACL|nr:2-oxoglutarate dehydrogenase E1 component [Fictibacillus macauensis]EIT86777.1 2-oxoglutarate dehydrogenase E1 component [Fictibacillus macauensis ZFHKF-1]